MRYNQMFLFQLRTTCWHIQLILSDLLQHSVLVHTTGLPPVLACVWVLRVSVVCRYCATHFHFLLRKVVLWGDHWKRVRKVFQGFVGFCDVCHFSSKHEMLTIFWTVFMSGWNWWICLMRMAWPSVTRVLSGLGMATNCRRCWIKTMFWRVITWFRYQNRQ